MRLLVTITFEPNQFRSHLLPIVAIPEVEEVVLVADVPPPPIPKVRAVLPSARERRLLGRSLAKLVLCARLARRLRPDWVLSYYLVPHGVNGLIASRVARCPSMYHMIGGPREWEGGGWRSGTPGLSRLPRPVPALERLLLGLVRRSAIVVTMGTGARDRLVALGFPPAQVEVLPPAVDLERFRPAPASAPRPYDLAIVAHLIPRKRVPDFLRIVARLRESRPALRAAIAGDGPLEADLRREAERLGVADAVDFLGRRRDIENVYRASRVFVLTSDDEGLSVAMTEAMACGVPAVVTDVGDLDDLLSEGRNGHLVPVGDVDAFVARIGALLDDPERYAAFSAAAREDAAARAAIPLLSDRYRRLLLGSGAVGSVPLPQEGAGRA